LNQPISAGHKLFVYSAWGLVLLTLVHLCGRQLRPNSEGHQLCTVTTKSAARHALIAPYERLDRMAGQTDNGNVLLKLAGSAKTNPAVKNSLEFIYYRTSYAFYPRRVYVAPADKIINNGTDIMQAEFNPDRQWLLKHNVRFVLTYGNDKPGETIQLQILPLAGDPAGVQTNQTGGN
jgi:hypothetical protein